MPTTELLKKAITGTTVKTIDEKKRTITFLGSTESVDRMGDIIVMAGWSLKNFKSNPVFLFGHNSNNPPIGRSLGVRKTKAGLEFDIEFADAETFAFADTIFRLFVKGFMKAVSVGFLPLKFEPRLDKKG